MYGALLFRLQKTILFNGRLILYGNVRDIGISGNRNKISGAYYSSTNNGIEASRRKSPHNLGAVSWWNSQSSSSRFSSPSNKSDSRGYIPDVGKNNANIGRGSDYNIFFKYHILGKLTHNI